MGNSGSAAALNDEVALRYLQGPGPHRLEIGAGRNGKRGWLATDLHATDASAEVPVISLDATKRFPLADGCLDFIYAEHMIEQIGFEQGLHMLRECFRVLKLGGVLRVVTPSLGFLLRIISPDRSPFEESYRDWAVTTFLPDAPAVTNAIFLNNFVRAWGHTFIYDRETLSLSMRLAGFARIVPCELNRSEHEVLRGLEHEGRMPEGFLALESMIIEGVKGNYRNIALGKSATQSSVSPWSLADTPERDASRVVSGKFTGSYNNHTGFDEPAWWRVDLGCICHISQVRIYNRTTSYGMMARANQFSIDLSDDDNVWHTVFHKNSDALVSGARYEPFVWNAEGSTKARFVRIRLDGRKYLHFDQVEVFGEDGSGQ